MHILVQILSNKRLSSDEIDDIMAPYYESTVYEDDEEIDVHPQFTWDYYEVLDPDCIEYHNDLGDCYVIFDPEGEPFAREWWNGETWVDQNAEFEERIEQNKDEWEHCKRYVLDAHC